MSSRKRKTTSHTAAGHQGPSKKVKPSSDPENQGEGSLVVSTASSWLVEGSGTVYQIKAIIGERKHCYLIDWEDDQYTGESFEPDWQPKGNASVEAVSAWEAKKASFNQASGFDSIPCSHPCVSRPTSRRIDSGSRTKVRKGHVTELKTPNRAESAERVSGFVRAQSASQPLEGSDTKDLIIRVSQHSSLDRDLYIAYESSLSTQGVPRVPSQQSLSQQSSVEQRSTSISQSAAYRSSPAGGVIPDSQSLPDSSSYFPTASSTDKSSSTSKTAFVDSQATQSGVDSQPASTLLVPASQESPLGFRRSRSAPASTIPDSTSNFSSLRTPLSLPRSISDPGLILCDQDRSQYCNYIEVPDSAEKPSSTPKESEGKDLELLDHLSASESQIVSLGLEIEVQNSPLHRAGSIPFAIAEDCSQDQPSQATTTDDSILSEIEPNSQSPRRRSVSPQKTSQSSRHLLSYEEDPRSPALAVSTAFKLRSHTLGEFDSMEDVPLASREGLDDSRAGSNNSTTSTQEKMKRLKDQGAAVTAPQKVERQRPLTKQQSSTSLRSPSGRSPRLNAPPSLRSPSSSSQQAHSTLKGSLEQQSPSLPSPLQLSARPSAPSPVPMSPLVREQTPTQAIFAREPLSDTSRSPSVIPDRPPYRSIEEPSRLEVQPLEINTAPEPLAPVRNTQLTPHTPITPSKLSFHKEVSFSPNHDNLVVCNLGDREYPIHISMSARIQQHYCATIRYHARAIKAFLEDGDYVRETIERVNTMLDEVSKVTTHIDLQGSGPSSQENMDPQCEADYAESCSEKFVFLGLLLEEARKFELRLCIVAKSGLLMSILETYLTAREVAWFRLNETSSKPRTVRGSLQVLLLPSDIERPGEQDLCSDLLIAFDETFERDKIRVLNRQQLLPPVIHLVVYASLEHIDLCVPRTLNPIERLRKLVYPLLQTQKRVGEWIKDNDPSPNVCAHIIAAFLNRSIISNSERPWPLQPIRPVEGIHFMDSDSSLSDAASDVSTDYKPPIRYWPNPIPPRILPQVGKNGKRPFDLEWGDSPATQAKKQRQAQQFLPGRTATVDEDEPTDLCERLEEAMRRIDSVKLELSKKTTLIKTLHSWAGIRQHAYEALRKEHGNLQVTQRELSTDLARGERGFQDLKTKNDTLTANYSLLQQELRDLQAQLNIHSDPVVAAAARDLGHQRALEAENVNLKKSLANLTTDFDFTRDQYQKASEMATENAAELEPLKIEIADLRRKREHNVAEYKRQIDKDVTKELRKENQRLKETVKQRDGLVMKLEGEITEMRRGRAGGMQTRGNSVQPKSPRAGSRGASPAAGFLGGHAMARGASGLGNSRFRD